MRDFLTEYSTMLQDIDMDLKMVTGISGEGKEARATANYLYRIERRNLERQYHGRQLSLFVLRYAFECLDVIRLHFIKRWGGRL